MARSAKLVTGRLSVHRDGFGFLIPDRRDEGFPDDIFLPPDAAAKAMHGDRVAVRITRLGRDGRAEGDIAKVLDRAHPTVVGTFRLRRRGMFVEPYDPRIQQWIEIPEGMAIPKESASTDRIGASAVAVNSPADLEGMIVDVEMLEFPDRGGGAVGRVIEILGRPGRFRRRCRNRHPQAPYPAPLSARRHRSGAARSPRRSRRPRSRGAAISATYRVVTIDGETARDFDDAVWVDRLPSGNFALHVHIADVSHYVRPGTPIDREAQTARHQRLLPGSRRADAAARAIDRHLLAQAEGGPPGDVRAARDRSQGDVVAQEFARGVIRSAERMTYTDVHGLLEGDATLRERYAPLVGRFETDAGAGVDLE